MFRSFEERLCDEWAVKRDDIYVEGVMPLDDHRACQPVRPHKALELLDVSEVELITMLARGMLRRPGRRGGGRVAWRCDEILAARELLDDIRIDEPRSPLSTSLALAVSGAEQRQALRR